MYVYAIEFVGGHGRRIEYMSLSFDNVVEKYKQNYRNLIGYDLAVYGLDDEPVLPDYVNEMRKAFARLTRPTRTFDEYVDECLNQGKIRALRLCDYSCHSVNKNGPIRKHVIDVLGEYRAGSAYYLLHKKEWVTENKKFLLFDGKRGTMFHGKLKDFVEPLSMAQVMHAKSFPTYLYPMAYDSYKLYIQSKSQNRNVFEGTSFVVVAKGL